MKKSELRKLIREVINEQRSRPPMGGNVDRDNLSQLQAAINRGDIPRDDNRASWIVWIICLLTRDCDWNDGDPCWPDDPTCGDNVPDPE